MEISDPTRTSWQINTSHGGDLALNLYVRDRLALMPAMEPQLAKLVPRVSQLSAVPDDRKAELEAQWVRWWQDQLRAHWEGARPHFDESVDSFPELASSIELLDIVNSAAIDGRLWVNERKKEFFEIFQSHRVRTGLLVELGNRYAIRYPFKLSITCLPVDDKRGWRVDREHALASCQLYADWRSYYDWLEGVIASAVGQ